MQVCVAQIGARRHYAVPVALHRVGMLDSLHTDWCMNRGLPRFVSAMTPAPLRTGSLRRLADRNVPNISPERIHTHLRYALSMVRRKKHTTSNYEYWALANQAFGESVVREGFGRADMVYGFNAAAVELLSAARRQGLRTALDQTMAPWKTVETTLAEERQRWPDWETQQAEQGWEALADRETLEWEAADVIICGSSYVVDAMAEMGAPVDRCRVVPYGYDSKLTDGAPFEHPLSPQKRPLRVLFVGTVELRKGVPYLMQAAEALDNRDVEFRVVGPMNVADAAVSQLRRVADVLGPVPRSNVSEHYRWADVFLLPTLAEGSANVCYEAMAHGVPVITTLNAGSVVRDGQDGWIIPAQSSQAIVDCLERLIDDRNQITAASNSAQQWISSFTWDRYGSELVSAIDHDAAEVNQPLKHQTTIERHANHAHHG